MFTNILKSLALIVAIAAPAAATPNMLWGGYSYEAEKSGVPVCFLPDSMGNILTVTSLSLVKNQIAQIGNDTVIMGQVIDPLETGQDCPLSRR